MSNYFKKDLEKLSREELLKLRAKIQIRIVGIQDQIDLEPEKEIRKRRSAKRHYGLFMERICNELAKRPKNESREKRFLTSLCNIIKWELGEEEFIRLKEKAIEEMDAEDKA